MEITTTISSVLNQKPKDLWSIGPDDTVFDAISLMAEKNVGALPVIKDGQLLGMLSERDYTRKVVLLGRASRQTPVSDIMARELIVVKPDDSVRDCMRLMTDNRVRHLPVMIEGRLDGILSIGDLVNWIISSQDAVIDDFERFVTGAYPG